MSADDDAMRTNRDPAPLHAFARALLAASAASSQPLPDLLAAHPVAGELLMDALLAGPAPAAAALPAAEAPAPVDARHIGPYRLESELGRGGQAVVYVATDTRLGRRVALKVLHGDVFQTAFREQRFRAEAATTSRLDHPGICPIYEVGEAGDLLFLAMRLVEGRTLAAHIDAARQAGGNRPFQLELAAPSTAGERSEGGARHLRPWLPVLRLFESFAEALHAAHQAGITHRDVKPGNLMVQPDGRGVVLDFGLAADASRDGATLTRTGDVFGTPAYMAPEQCRGERCDHRVDVWALGASLFEALTGQRAFAAATPEATIRTILGGAVPNPCRLLRTLPFELGVVVGKALDPEPLRRYATAQEFGDDLRRIRELLPIVAVPPSVLLRARRFAQRNPWLVAMVVVLVVAFGVGAWLVAATQAKALENEVLFLRQDLEDLVAEFPLLQPVSEHRERAARWLQQGEALLGHRGMVEALRDQLRRGGEMVLDGDPGVEAKAVQQELDRLAGIDAAVAAGRGVPDTVQYLAAEPQVQQRQTARQQLVAQAEKLRAWRVANPGDKPLHDSCVKLLADLDQFAAEQGPHRSVQRELASLGSATVGWPEAIEAIRLAPAYGGLLLRPQRELQPLGLNAWGLYEFAHLRSGPPPTRRPDGSYAFADDTGIVLVLLPGGRVTVGAQRAEPAGRRYEPNLRSTEDYLVELSLDPFLIAKHETTRAQWLRLGGRDRSHWRIGWQGVTVRHPVDNMSWAEAMEVLGRSGLTLPTEAQWEYAARAIEHVDQEVAIDGAAAVLAENLYDASAAAARMSSVYTTLPGRDGFPYTAPVGRFAPNGFGLHDLRGNVQEWCLDAEAYPNLDVFTIGTGAWLAEPGDKHPARGHSFLNDLSLSPLTSRTLTGGGEKERGCRAARRLER